MTMNNTKENLHKSLLRHFPESFSPNDSQIMSPISSLAQNLLGASLTPRKRLSLSSSISGTPTSFLELSMTSVDSDSAPQDFSKSCDKQQQQQQPLSTSRNKENMSTPYYSPSHRLYHKRRSPLRNLQNNCNRSLGFSPLKKLISPSKREHLSPVKMPGTGVDECDSTSRDSGYCESDKKNSFSSCRKSSDGFNIPLLSAPSRKLNLDLSPSPVTQQKSGRRMRSFASLSKQCHEDGFLCDLLGEDFEDDSKFPVLCSAPITSKQLPSAVPTPPNERLPIRRCLSMFDTSPLNPIIKPARLNSTEDVSNLKKSPEATVNKSTLLAFGTVTPTSTTLSFKRPQPPTDNTPCPNNVKRRRSEIPELTTLYEKGTFSLRQKSSPEPDVPVEEGRPRIHRSHSESHVSIMKTLNFASQGTGPLTGDYSRPLALPVIEGKHPDLKSIDSDTMARLLNGDFEDQISSFRILDCRYPYEFEGGHITNAVNWHHPKMILDHLEACIGTPKSPASGDCKRDILIFHCEFSAERGPRAQRLLRENDRMTSYKKDYYPKLHFPELYLLEGGYREFYESHSDLCSPKKYVKMVDENHAEDLKLFRAKSKSWTSENKLGRTRRTASKRL